jgi:hypothetical protein
MMPGDSISRAMSSTDHRGWLSSGSIRRDNFALEGVALVAGFSSPGRL